MTKKFFLLLVVLLVVWGSLVPARAQGRFGIGFIIGDPTGFSWKYKLSSQNVLDGAIGFSPYDRFRFHVDYLWVARPFNDNNFSLTYGVGGAAGFGRTEYIVVRGRGGLFTRDYETGFGFRVPVGLSYMIPRSPLELTLELAPLFVAAPVGDFGVDGGFAVRFYP